MNQNLLIYFAIPLAVIILSAIFETFINCPLKVAGITFAILLIVAFAAFGTEFLVAVIIYTILSYITAFIINRYNERDDKLQNMAFQSLDRQEKMCRLFWNWQKAEPPNALAIMRRDLTAYANSCQTAKC